MALRRLPSQVTHEATSGASRTARVVKYQPAVESAALGRGLPEVGLAEHRHDDCDWKHGLDRNQIVESYKMSALDSEQHDIRKHMTITVDDVLSFHPPS